MRILITGANGQVGHELLRALADSARECEIIPVTRGGKLEDGAACEVLDLADFDGLTEALDRIAPDVIINAAAYTAVDRAEDEPELAQRTNGDALGVLGAWARRHGARVVHYSTDYVFDGSATRPYRETDTTHPISVYGRSKLAGENALRDSGARHLIFRTAWVYAARGQNFLRTMLRLGAERDELRVVDDQLGAPTPARLIADVTAQVIAQWNTLPSTGRESPRSGGGMPASDGTYHLVASGQTSWCGFARAIFERACIPFGPPSQAKGEENHLLPKEGGRREAPGGCNRAPRVVAIRTADYPTKAKRPAYSVLDATKLRDAFGVDLPDWQAALDGVIAELMPG